MTLGLNVSWIGESIGYTNVTEDPLMEELWFEEFNCSARRHTRLFYSIKFFISAGFDPYDVYILLLGFGRKCVCMTVCACMHTHVFYYLNSCLKEKEKGEQKMTGGKCISDCQNEPEEPWVIYAFSGQYC